MGGFFSGGFFWEDLFGRNSLRELIFCQDFGVILSKGRRKEDFRSLEVRRKLIALKKNTNKQKIIFSTNF